MYSFGRGGRGTIGDGGGEGRPTIDGDEGRGGRKVGGATRGKEVESVFHCFGDFLVFVQLVDSSCLSGF